MKITEENFDEIFKPQINHFERAKADKSTADQDVCGFNGTLYETFGEELDYVFNLAKTTKRVWTVVEDEDDLFLVAGFRLVNRIGFIVCENEYKNNSLVIKLD